MKSDYFSIKFEDNKFIFLDQTKLPLEEVYVTTTDYERIAEAIEKLEIRGAPLIGISAAYALALAVNEKGAGIFPTAYTRLERTRPTAVNLFFALNEMKNEYDATRKDAAGSEDIYARLLNKAVTLHNQDIDYCRRIGGHGLRIFKKKSKVLTHCNTGKLATGGDGTAFSVIKTGFENELVSYVYADETRPLFQGLRLTAFELEHSGIPFSVLSDSMAASLMQRGEVDLVITGADRIALNGDSANKIGTYSLAVLCNFHNIPFYIAAPSTTIDRKILTGEDIIIEFRKKEEILKINGDSIAPSNYEAYTPSFDVTPSHLITGIITEDDIYSFPYNFLI